jgi:hypothetical protein
LKEFKEALANSEQFKREIGELAEAVTAFTEPFELPGGDDF